MARRLHRVRFKKHTARHAPRTIHGGNRGGTDPVKDRCEKKDGYIHCRCPRVVGAIVEMWVAAKTEDEARWRALEAYPGATIEGVYPGLPDSVNPLPLGGRGW